MLNEERDRRSTSDNSCESSAGLICVQTNDGAGVAAPPMDLARTADRGLQSTIEDEDEVAWRSRWCMYCLV